MRNYAHKIGALFYLFWGILHICAGTVMLAADSATEQLALLSTAPLTPEELPGHSRGIVCQKSDNCTKERPK